MTRPVPLRLDRFPAGEVRRTALVGGITSPSVELVRIGELELVAYRAAGGVVSGLGLAWGRAVNSAMFVGEVAQRSAEQAELMVWEGLRAFDEVGPGTT